jgi:hypothetical protein
MQDQLVYFWLPYLTGVVFLVLGLIVYRLQGADYAANIFVSLSVFVSVLTGGLFDLVSYHLLTPLWSLFLPLSGAALIHFGFVFTAPGRLIRRRGWIIFVPYGVAQIFGLINLYSFYLAPDPRLYLSARFLDFAFITLAILVFLFQNVNRYINSLSSVIRRQTLIIFVGEVLAFAPASLWAAASMLGFFVPLTILTFALIILPFIIFPITVAYASSGTPA